MVPVSDFYPELRLMVPGVMNDVMETAIIQTARKFCKSTNLFLLTEDLTGTTEKQSITIPELWETSGQFVSGMVFSNIVKVIGDGDRLDESLDYSVPSKGNIIVSDKYDELSIIASIQPGNSVTELPEKLFDDHSEVICHGAAAYLYVLPTSMNGDLHQYHEREYIEAMRSVKRWLLNSLPNLPRQTRQRTFY